MTLEEVGRNYLDAAEKIRIQITGLRPLLEIYRDDKLNTLKQRILILYRIGRHYRAVGNCILKLNAAC